MSRTVVCMKCYGSKKRVGLVGIETEGNCVRRFLTVASLPHSRMALFHTEITRERDEAAVSAPNTQYVHHQQQRRHHQQQQ